MPRKQRKNWPMRIAAVLLCLVLATTYMLTGLYAKFTTQDSAHDNARTAAFEFHANGVDTVMNLNQIKKPGDKQEFTFTVTNGKSEVDQTYTVVIKELGSLPLEYTLTGAGAKHASASGQEIVNDNGTFQASVTGSEKYILEVKWPTDDVDDRDPKYAGGVAAVSIRIVSTQVD